MPFVLRVTDFPTTPQILELEQIVIVDRTGPSITLGISSGVSALVGEFLKGPFVPREVTSAAEITSIYGGVSQVFSQDSPNLVSNNQDGSGVFFDGNGMLQLKNKTFRRLLIQRVDGDMVTADLATPKVFVRFNVTVDPIADITSGKTNKDIQIPAGTRFADAPLATSTVIVALSQDILIPKGTTTAGTITVSSIVGTTLDLTQDVNGGLTRPIDSTGAVTGGPMGASAFFVKGITAGIALIDTCLDTALPNVLSSIAPATGISTVNAAGASAAAFAAAAAAGANLKEKIATMYTGGTLIPGAIDKTLPTDNPLTQITVIWAARNTTGIRNRLWQNAQDASQQSRGRIACVSADPATSITPTVADASAAKTAALALPPTFFGVNADRVCVNFPYAFVFSSELGSRNVLVSPDGFKASLFSNLAEEVQSSVQNTVIQVIQGLEPAFGVVSPLVRADYVNFKAAGLSALRRDRAVGWIFQSAITAIQPLSFPTRTADNRRRFADFVQDTLVALSAKYQNFPGTTERIDALVGEIDGFLSSLLSKQNPSQQRIEAYSIDEKSGNTPQLTALGIRVIKVKVRMLGDLNDLLYDTQIGPTVEIQVSQAA